MPTKTHKNLYKFTQCCIQVTLFTQGLASSLDSSHVGQQHDSQVETSSSPHQLQKLTNNNDVMNEDVLFHFTGY